MTFTPQTTSIRELHFGNLNDIVFDAESRRELISDVGGVVVQGQILEHLAVSLDCSFDGFPFQAPWFLRKLVSPFIKNGFITKPMRAGFKLPANAGALSPGDVSVEEGLAHLKKAVARYETETPNVHHPVFGRMARQEWVSLGLRHAELHMSFVVPVGD